jgi:hypothetical protein
MGWSQALHTTMSTDEQGAAGPEPAAKMHGSFARQKMGLHNDNQSIKPMGTSTSVPATATFAAISLQKLSPQQLCFDLW